MQIVFFFFFYTKRITNYNTIRILNETIRHFIFFLIFATIFVRWYLNYHVLHRAAGNLSFRTGQRFPSMVASIFFDIDFKERIVGNHCANKIILKHLNDLCYEDRYYIPFVVSALKTHVRPSQNRFRETVSFDIRARTI